MKALLLIAHGSRQSAANEEVRRLTARLRRRAGDRFGHTSCAFLQFAEPSVAEGIEACIGLGATQVTLLPYLLGSGHHLAVEIPRTAAARQKAHPEVVIRLAPHVGAAPGLADLLLGIATDS
jgi:sirohydrochlorin ferrochelatase